MVKENAFGHDILLTIIHYPEKILPYVEAVIENEFEISNSSQSANKSWQFRLVQITYQ